MFKRQYSNLEFWNCNKNVKKKRKVQIILLYIYSVMVFIDITRHFIIKKDKIWQY